MTRTTKILLAGGALTLAIATAAGVSQAGGRGFGPCGAGGPGGPGGPGFGPAAMWGPGGPGRGPGPMLFEQFDTNGDGTLTQAEIDQARADQLAEFDANGDGSLTLDEYQALWMHAMRESMVDRFQSHDDDGDGVVTAEEFGARTGDIVARLDRDGDGEITLDEMGPSGGRGWGPPRNDDDDN